MPFIITLNCATADLIKQENKTKKALKKNVTSLSMYSRLCIIMCFQTDFVEMREWWQTKILKSHSPPFQAIHLIPIIPCFLLFSLQCSWRYWWACLWLFQSPWYLLVSYFSICQRNRNSNEREVRQRWSMYSYGVQNVGTCKCTCISEFLLPNSVLYMYPNSEFLLT